MLKLKDNVTLEDLKPYDFHSFKRDGFTTWYRCVARGCKLILINIQDKTTIPDILQYVDRQVIVDRWYGEDDRIHKNPKCHYKDLSTVEEIIYELTKAGLIERKREGYKNVLA